MISFRKDFVDFFKVVPNKWAYDYICWLEDKEIKETPDSEMILCLLSLIIPPMHNVKRLASGEIGDTKNYAWIENDLVHVSFSHIYDGLRFYCYVLKSFADAINCTLKRDKDSGVITFVPKDNSFCGDG